MFSLHFCTLTGSGDVFIPICFTVYGRCVKHVARGSETARQRASKGPALLTAAHLTKQH